MIEHNTEAVTEPTGATMYASAPAESDAARVETGTTVEDTTDTVSAELDALKAALAAKEAELLDFKRDVSVITGRYAEKHDLCTVVDTALSELGLRRMVETRRVEVTLKMSYEVETQTGRDTRVNDASVWTMVHNIAYNLRHSSVEDVVRSYADQPSSRGMVIDAEVSIGEPSDDPAGFMLPEGPRKRCTNCDSPMRTRPSGKLRCPHGCNDDDRS